MRMLDTHTRARLGEALVAALLAAGLTMLLAADAELTVHWAWIYGGAFAAAGALFGFSLSRRPALITVSAIAAAMGIALIAGWRPVTRIAEILHAARAQESLDEYMNELGVGVMLAMLVASYIIAQQSRGVYLMAFLTLAVLAVGWFYGDSRLSWHLAPVLAALSAMFARSGTAEKAHPKALLSLSLVAAIVAVGCTPAAGVRLPVLEQASQKTLRFILRTLNIEKDNLNERRSFSIASDGWIMRRDRFGGPAYPSDSELMRVETSETVYLRGGIRYVYDTHAWVDESNEDKAGKVRRYMMHGIEGLIYRSDFEAAFDVGKRLAERYLANGTIGVEVLMDNPSWSIYAPSRTKDVDIADANVYFNNLGELFINRPLRAGDWYTLDIDRLTVGELEIEQALADCEGAADPAYAAALVLNRDLPLGIDSALYQQTYEIIAGAETPYQRASAICDWLKLRGEYTLTPEPVPEGRDMVSYFVLEAPEGYCVYFASAMAVMARIAGLPARYVEGYLAVPDENGECVVTGRNAHAWAEVYFKGFGWVVFDATPPDDQQDEQESDESENAQGGNAGGAQPTATPAPTDGMTEDAPTATPEPTNPSNGSEGNEPTPTPTPDPNGDGMFGNTGNDEPETTPEPDNMPRAKEEDSSRGRAWRLVLLLILLLLVIAAAVLLVRRRLKATDPLSGSERFSGEDRLMFWYRAMLTALSQAGVRYEPGDTPSSLAARALERGACTEAFVAFSAAVAVCRYAARPADRQTYALARDAYLGIVGRMKPAARMKWRTQRVLHGVGPVGQVP